MQPYRPYVFGPIYYIKQLSLLASVEHIPLEVDYCFSDLNKSIKSLVLLLR